MKIERVCIDRTKLKVQLAKRDMSQRELTELSGISKTTVSAILGGKWCMPNTAHRIAEALGVELKDITVITEGA